MNPFQLEIAEKERAFEARLLEIKGCKYWRYIGEKLGTKTVLKVDKILDNGKYPYLRDFFVWKCDCGTEGKTMALKMVSGVSLTCKNCNIKKLNS